MFRDLFAKLQHIYENERNNGHYLPNKDRGSITMMMIAVDLKEGATLKANDLEGIHQKLDSTGTVECPSENCNIK